VGKRDDLLEVENDALPVFKVVLTFTILKAKKKRKTAELK